MTSTTEFAGTLSDGNTFGWYIADHPEDIGRLVGTSETVSGFFVYPGQGDEVEDRMKSDVWLLTEKGLLHYFVDTEKGTTEVLAIPLAAISRVTVRTEGIAEKPTFHSGALHKVKSSTASVTLLDGSAPLEFCGKDWMSGWGNHPPEAAVAGALGFFQGLPVVLLG